MDERNNTRLQWDNSATRKLTLRKWGMTRPNSKEIERYHLKKLGKRLILTGNYEPMIKVNKSNAALHKRKVNSRYNSQTVYGVNAKYFRPKSIKESAISLCLDDEYHFINAGRRKRRQLLDSNQDKQKQEMNNTLKPVLKPPYFTWNFISIMETRYGKKVELGTWGGLSLRSIPSYQLYPEISEKMHHYLQVVLLWKAINWELTKIQSP